MSVKSLLSHCCYCLSSAMLLQASPLSGRTSASDYRVCNPSFYFTLHQRNQGLVGVHDVTTVSGWLNGLHPVALLPEFHWGMGQFVEYWAHCGRSPEGRQRRDGTSSNSSSRAMRYMGPSNVTLRDLSFCPILVRFHRELQAC